MQRDEARKQTDVQKVILQQNAVIAAISEDCVSGVIAIAAIVNKLCLVGRKPVFRVRENKGADQLRSYCAADLRLCFPICKKAGFLMTRLK